MIANGQNITTLLGVSPPAPAPTVSARQPVEITIDKERTTAENDFEYARRNMYDIIEGGQDALSEVINFAKQAQTPRAFEVAATLINNLTIANEKLLNLSKQIKDIQKDEEQKEPDQKITNNLFVGSTAELQKLLKGG